jgi:geranylgeranyl pyrophosphate synthase
MFVSVSKYSIPGIGIPLLTCGCKDTLADFDWIKQEIHHIHQNSNLRLLNLNYLRNKASAIFEEESLKKFFGPLKNKTEEIAINALLVGGQRLRPLLTILTYEAFSAQTNPEVVNRIAISVECFHKASLIHDDIEDGDDIRYGKETIHARYGIPIAINTGDFLIGEGYRLITDCELPANLICDSVKIISQGHKNLTIGQGTELISVRNKEILSLEKMLTVFENKTAAAFKVSILLGATLGGANKETLDLLDKFSNYAGIAYQIKDDLSDYQGDKGDIASRKFSVILSMLVEKLTSQEKEQFQKVISTNDLNKIYELITRYQIEQQTEILLKDYIQKAKQCLDDLRNMGLKLALYEILGKIFKDYI